MASAGLGTCRLALILVVWPQRRESEGRSAAESRRFPELGPERSGACRGAQGVSGAKRNSPPERSGKRNGAVTTRIKIAKRQVLRPERDKRQKSDGTGFLALGAIGFLSNSLAQLQRSFYTGFWKTKRVAEELNLSNWRSERSGDRKSY